MTQQKESFGAHTIRRSFGGEVFGRGVINEARRIVTQETGLPGQYWLRDEQRTSGPTRLTASTMHSAVDGRWKYAEIEIDCTSGVMNARPVGSDKSRLGLVPSELSMQVRESGLVEVTAELIRGVHTRLVRALFDAGGNLRDVSFGIAGGPYGLQRSTRGELGPTPFSGGENPRERVTMSEEISLPSSARESTSRMQTYTARVIHDLGFGTRVRSEFTAEIGDFVGDKQDSLRAACPDQHNDPAVTLIRSLPTHFASGPEALRWLFEKEIDRVMADIPPTPSGAPSPDDRPAAAASAVAVAATG